jgi:GT2 family glycosyltransferase
MVRRLRPTESRGSKKRSSAVSYNDVNETAADLVAAEVLEAVEIGRTLGEAERDGEFDQTKMGGLMPMGGSDQQVQQGDIFRPIDVGNNEAIFAERFDEAGYLLPNSDVKRTIELGQIESDYSHDFRHVSAGLRPLPGTPREARNVMLASPHGAGLDVSVRGARGSVEALIIAPGAGLIVAGWIDDTSNPLSCICMTGPDWRVVIDSSRYVRVRRMDVEQKIGGGRSHLFGFIGFLHFNRGGHGSGPIRMELWQESGPSTALECAPELVGDAELRDKVLAYIGAASFFGNASIEAMSYLARGIGEELVRFNRSITRRIVAGPYVERFGPQNRAPRGSIVVCLYGKPEFLFLQNCLYSGLPGIHDYEFIYVSNSPEMAETLLREARNANLLYGLTNSVVILPGNAGFGAANNVAVGVARSDRLLVVNPDVFPRDRDWAKKHTELLAAAPADQTRIFGVPLYYDDGSLMHGGMYFEVDVGLSLSGGKPCATRICRTQHYGKGSPADGMQFTRPRPVPAVTGAFISIERSWYEQLGGFTEDFIFGHYEDADLCLRSIARGTAPWLQDIRMWHLEGKGSTWQPQHVGGSIVNRWLFSNAWMPMIDDGLTGPEPMHELLQSIPTVRSAADSDQPKRKIGRQGGAS